MSPPSRFGIVAALVVSVVVLATFGVLFAVGTGANTPPPPSSTRALSISWDAASSTYSYRTTNLQVPLGSTVTFVVTNHDPGTVASVPSVSDAVVSGTVGGTMTVSENGTTATVTSVEPASLSHTFTVSSGPYRLNVPIPAAPSAGTPVVVSFTVAFPTPGTFAWGCVLPCGTEDMTRMGTMYGYLLVA